MAKILGIDEAGRGPLIGPLVVAGAMIEEQDNNILAELGIKDSKLLSAKKRTLIFQTLKQQVKHHIITISPQEIDTLRNQGTSLNTIEAQAMIKIIEELKPDIVYIDCPSINMLAFEQYVQSHLSYTPRLHVAFKADRDFLIVGAASIIAKVTRDNAIETIKQDHHVDCGSGYPSDQKTVNCCKQHPHLPIYRTTWESYKRIQKENEQQTLI